MSKQTDKKLTHKRETLRELTKAELLLVAGGQGKMSQRCVSRDAWSIDLIDWRTR